MMLYNTGMGRFIAFFLLFVSSVLVAFDEVKLPSIHYKNRETVLNNSLYVLDDQVYFPFLELPKLLGMQISVSPKSNGYRLYTDSLDYTFVRHSKEVWVNRSKQFMSYELRDFHGKPYIELSNASFIFGLNYQLENDGKIIRFTSKKDSVLFTKSPYAIFDELRVNMTYLPLKKLPKTLYLAYHDVHVPIQDYVVQEKDVFFIQAKAVLEALSFSYIETSTSIQLSYNNFTYNIPKDSRFWTTTYKKDSWSFMATTQPKVINGALYFELESLFSFLDFSLYWNSSQNTIELLSLIHSFDFVEDNGAYKIDALSRYPLKIINEDVDKKNDTYRSIIPYAAVLTKEKKSLDNHAIVRFIELKNSQNNSDRSREESSKGYRNKSNVKISYRLKDVEYVAYFKENKAQKEPELSVQLDSRLRSMSVLENAKAYQITFLLSESVSAKVLKDGNKLILDFPQTVNELPRLRQFDSHDLISMRTSQFSISPLVSRVVLDFSGAASNYKVSQSKQAFVITVDKMPLKKALSENDSLAIKAPLLKEDRLKKDALSDKTVITTKENVKKNEPLPEKTAQVKKDDTLKKDPLPEIAALNKKGEAETEKNSQVTVNISEKPDDQNVIKVLSEPKINAKKSKDLLKRVIIVDAGHGGNDPGAIVQGQYYEKYYTIDIAKKLAEKLKDEGAKVIMTRSDDTNPSLKRRTEIANDSKADIFVSIHINSFSTPDIHGSSTYYYKPKDQNLALFVQNQLKKDLGILSNGIKRNRFYVLRYTEIPSILVETLYMTNPNEFELIQKESYREQVASSILLGIKGYFKSYTPEKSPTSKKRRN